MSNADILFGAVALLGYCFILAPMIGSSINRNATYKNALLAGNFLTLFVVVVGVVGAATVSAVLYFAGELRPDTPTAEFIEWVNAL